MIPRVGRPPEPGRKYKIRHGVYALLPARDRLLLTRQYADAPEIQLPGGGIDPGEHPIAALHREVLEETGWTIRSPRRLGAFRNFTYMPEYDLWAEKLCTIYWAEPVRRLGPPTEPDHHPLWLTPDQAAHVVASPGDALFIKAYMSRA